MSKFAEELSTLLADRIKEDPFDVVETMIALSAHMMASDHSLKFDAAQTICLSIFHHNWNLRRRAVMPCDKSVH
jgi:hypothetical protein